MESNILNFHDLVLFMSILAGFYLALMMAVEKKIRGRFYLPVFLVLVAMEALYVLSSYSLVGVTYIASSIPAFYFFLAAAFYVKGQALYFYVRVQLVKDYRLSQRSLCHIFPLLIYVCTIISSYNENTDLYGNFNLWKSNFTNPFTYHFTLIAYSIATLGLFAKYHVNGDEAGHSEFEKKVIWQLLAITGSYLVIWLVTFGAHAIYHMTQNISVASAIGKLAIYLNFIMLIALFTFFWRKEKNVNVPIVPKLEDKSSLNQHIDVNLRRIGQLMEDRKLYLQSNITLEQMANELETTPRGLSIMLNEFYGINFYQYLNHNRIEEAKRLLENQDDKTQISSIYSLAGFTSRTTFNVKFKEFVGKTPSEYRRALMKNI